MISSQKTIVLLSSEGNLKGALSQVKGKALVIALDEPAFQAAKSSGEWVFSIGEYLKISESELRAASEELAFKWYRVNETDYSQFDGCSLGELMNIELGHFNLFELMRKIVMVEVISAEESPSGWVLATGQNKLWRKIIQSSAARSIPVTSIGSNWLALWRRHANFKEMKLWLRRHGLDYGVRAWAVRFARWRKPQKMGVPSEKKYLFVVDIPATSALETMFPVIREALPEERLVVSTDPRCTKALDTAAIASQPLDGQALGVSIDRAARAVQSQMSKQLRARWADLERAVLAQSTPLLGFHGLDLWTFCRDDFRNFFLRRLPQALEHYQLARAVFKAYQSRVMITASDSHYIGMLFVRAAEREGRRSLAIQHGMVNHPGGYLPVRATQLAVMGEAIAEWLVEYGAKPEQIVVTGQPRFDALIQPPSKDRSGVLSELGLQPEAQTWLIAPEPQLGVWMRQVLFDALQALQDVQAVVRVHPNDNPQDYQMALKTYPDLSSRVCISRSYDVPSALNACDVLVFGRSTLGLEALLLDKPLIVVRPPDSAGWILPPYLHDYLNSVNFLCAQTADELVHAWRALHHAGTLPQIQQVKETIVRRYACSRDGQNAKRVIAVARRLGDEVQL